MLPPEQRHRLRELFDRAVGLSNVQRADFCARHCGDDELLRAELQCGTSSTSR